MTLQTPILLWDKSADEKDYHSSLKSDENVDAAIIGGGFVSANCFTVLSSGIYC